MNNRLINTKAAGGGGCTDIVDNYDPFGGDGVALYQLNGNANDVSGNYNGTATSVTYGTGVFGQAAVFNGSTSKILTSLTANPNEISYSLWFNRSTFGNDGNGRTLISKEYSGSNYGFNVFEYQNQLNIQIRAQSGPQYNINSFLAINANTWYNFIFVFKNQQIIIYINNNYINSFLISNITTPNPIEIGANSLDPDGFWQKWGGSIDQVRIFNTALDPLEVEALYTEQLCICDGTVDTLDILGDTSCIATYQLDGNANDLSGNYSGTATNVSYGVGEFDLAGVFNGSSSSITTTNPTFNSTNWSVSLWAKAPALNSGFDIGFLWQIGTGLNLHYRENPNNVLALWISDLSSQEAEFYTGVVSNQWYNITIVRSGNSFLHYVNGGLVLTRGYTGANTSNAFRLGNRTDGVWPFWGSIDQVRIFNKALNATEVTTLYNETACTPPIVENCFDVTSLVYLGKKATGIKTALGAAGSNFARDLQFNNDGTKLFLNTWFTNGAFEITVFGLDLSVPYDISTWSYNSNKYLFGTTGNSYGFNFNTDGTKLYLTNNYVLTEYNLSTPYNLTTISAAINSFNFSSQMTGNEVYTISFNNDGTKLFASNQQYRLFEYSLTTPYSLSSVTYTQQSIALNSSGGVVYLKLNPDGTKVLYKGFTNSQILSRNLSTPFDVSTISTTETGGSGVPMSASYDPITYNPTGTIAVGFNLDILYSLNMCY